MRAVVYDSPRTFEVKEVPTPDPAPGQILVKVIQTGLCGTDLHIHEGGFGATFPLIPGHEVVGTVAALGEGVTGFAEGEQVTINPNAACGVCAYCRSGDNLLCVDFLGLGSGPVPGGFAEYLVMPATQVYSAEGLDPDLAVFAEPASCAVHGVHRAQVRPGTSALVFGAGPTGVLLAQLLARGGTASVTMAASNQAKLDRARTYGIDRTLTMDRADLAGSVRRLRELAGADGGYDLVVEATGALDVAEVCVGLTRNGGTVLVYGVTDDDDRVPFAPFDVFRREITIKGSFAQMNDFPQTMALLRGGRLKTEGLITHRFGLEEYAEAMQALRTDRTAHKVVLVA